MRATFIFCFFLVAVTQGLPATTQDEVDDQGYIVVMIDPEADDVPQVPATSSDSTDPSETKKSVASVYQINSFLDMLSKAMLNGKSLLDKITKLVSANSFKSLMKTVDQLEGNFRAIYDSLKDTSKGVVMDGYLQPVDHDCIVGVREQIEVLQEDIFNQTQVIIASENDNFGAFLGVGEYIVNAVGALQGLSLQIVRTLMFGEMAAAVEICQKGKGSAQAVILDITNIYNSGEKQFNEATKKSKDMAEKLLAYIEGKIAPIKDALEACKTIDDSFNDINNVDDGGRFEF